LPDIGHIEFTPGHQGFPDFSAAPVMPVLISDLRFIVMNRSQKDVMQRVRTQGAIAPMTNVRIQFRMPILLRPMHAKQAHPLGATPPKGTKTPLPKWATLHHPSR
jgi:hypothetical protein